MKAVEKEMKGGSNANPREEDLEVGSSIHSFFQINLLKLTY